MDDNQKIWLFDILSSIDENRKLLSYNSQNF